MRRLPTYTIKCVYKYVNILSINSLRNGSCIIQSREPKSATYFETSNSLNIYRCNFTLDQQNRISHMRIFKYSNRRTINMSIEHISDDTPPIIIHLNCNINTVRRCHTEHPDNEYDTCDVYNMLVCTYIEPGKYDNSIRTVHTCLNASERDD